MATIISYLTRYFATPACAASCVSELPPPQPWFGTERPSSTLHLQGQHVIAETRRLSAIELGIRPGFGDHKRK